MKLAFLDISALFEMHWTGIPSVVAGIAGHALHDTGIDWRFIYDTVEVPSDLVDKFLMQRSGAGGMDALASLVWERTEIAHAFAAQGAAIFPNIKPVRSFFGKEAIIVHDLSPIITPQFHNKDNIVHFAYRIRQDIESSDHVFCVSQATRGDVRHYFRKADEETSVIRLGLNIEAADLTAAHIASEGISVEPYVVVLGTLEPRKNGKIVLDYIAQNPSFADRFRIVFVGRDGWLAERERLLEHAEKQGVRTDRIIFTGFVGEADKLALMLNSRFCIYPSFFEGFGLPILEAGVLGKVTVASSSSSMREVIPERCVFFDPADIHQFGAALRIAEHQANQTRSAMRCRSDIMADCRVRSWTECYATIAAWIEAQ